MTKSLPTPVVAALGISLGQLDDSLAAALVALELRTPGLRWRPAA